MIDVQTDHVKWAIRSRKAKVNWNGKEANGALSAFAVIQIYLDKTVSTMKCGAFVMYLMHAVVLTLREELRRKLIYNENKLVGFLPVENEERGDVVEKLEQLESNEEGGMVSRSELVAVKHLTAPTTSSGSSDAYRDTITF